METMWAYIAGCIDCDGSIIKSKNNNGCKNIFKYRYVINITQHEKLFDKMKIINDFINENNIKSSISKRKTVTKFGTGKMVDINIRDQKSLKKICEKIIPFLLFKKERATECLNSMNERLEVRKKVGVNNKEKQETNKYWVQEEIDLMLKLKSEGYGNPAIGNILNRSTNSIAQKLSKLRV